VNNDMDLGNFSTNQDLLIAGGGYLLLKQFGVIDLVKSRIAGSNGNNKSLKQFVSSESDAKENSRVMIQEIHDMGKRQDTRGEQSVIEGVKQTEILRSMENINRNIDENIRLLLDFHLSASRKPKAKKGKGVPRPR
jgi:hypothetical protein